MVIAVFHTHQKLQEQLITLSRKVKYLTVTHFKFLKIKNTMFEMNVLVSGIMILRTVYLTI